MVLAFLTLFMICFPLLSLMLLLCSIYPEIHCSRNMKKNWEERSSLIGQLEEKVVKMKDNFEGKEKKLRDERDVSLKAAK